MTTKSHTARARAWKTAFEKYLSLNQRLIEAQAHERDALERAVAAQQDALLDLPAPSLRAIVHKLEIIFEGDLEKPDQDGEEKRLVLEDLGDLILEQGQLLGVQLPA